MDNGNTQLDVRIGDNTESNIISRGQKTDDNLVAKQRDAERTFLCKLLGHCCSLEKGPLNHTKWHPVSFASDKSQIN
jgi:hypothetical protein